MQNDGAFKMCEGMHGAVFGEPHALFQRFVSVPCGHGVGFFRNVGVVKRFEIRQINGVIPRAAAWTPSKHVQAARFDEPAADQILPLPLDGLIQDNHYARWLPYKRWRGGAWRQMQVLWRNSHEARRLSYAAPKASA